VRGSPTTLAVLAVTFGLTGCIPRTNEERAQDYIYREYGPEYNVLACEADGLFDDQGTTVACVVENNVDEWDITVEFDGDGGEVVRIRGMPPK
jgi:hypothetical protein